MLGCKSTVVGFSNERPASLHTVVVGEHPVPDANGCTSAHSSRNAVYPSGGGLPAATAAAMAAATPAIVFRETTAPPYRPPEWTIELVNVANTIKIARYLVQGLR